MASVVRMAAIVLLLVCVPLAAQVDLGSLEIHSEPGAVLQWEGTFLGTTDEDGLLEVTDIPPGTYGLGLTRNGFLPAAEQVEIRAGERTVLELLLRAEAAPLRAEAAPDRAEPAPTSVPDVSAETSSAAEEPVKIKPSPKPAPPPDVPAETSSAEKAPLPTPESAPPTEPASDRGAAAISPPSPPFLLIALLAAVAFVAFVLYLRRNRPAPPALEAAAPPEPPAPTVQRIPRPDSSPEFLKELKSRERDLDRLVADRRGHRRESPEPIEVEVIDVEVTEVTEAPDPPDAAGTV